MRFHLEVDLGCPDTEKKVLVAALSVLGGTAPAAPAATATTKKSTKKKPAKEDKKEEAEPEKEVDLLKEIRQLILKISQEQDASVAIAAIKDVSGGSAVKASEVPKDKQPDLLAKLRELAGGKQAPKEETNPEDLF